MPIRAWLSRCRRRVAPTGSSRAAGVPQAASPPPPPAASLGLVPRAACGLVANAAANALGSAAGAEADGCWMHTVLQLRKHRCSSGSAISPAPIGEAVPDAGLDSRNVAPPSVTAYFDVELQHCGVASSSAVTGGGGVAAVTEASSAPAGAGAGGDASPPSRLKRLRPLPATANEDLCPSHCRWRCAVVRNECTCSSALAPSAPASTLPRCSRCRLLPAALNAARWPSHARCRLDMAALGTRSLSGACIISI